MTRDMRPPLMAEMVPHPHARQDWKTEAQLRDDTFTQAMKDLRDRAMYGEGRGLDLRKYPNLGKYPDLSEIKYSSLGDANNHFYREKLEPDVDEARRDSCGMGKMGEISKRDLNLLKYARARLYDFPTQVPLLHPATFGKEDEQKS